MEKILVSACVMGQKVRDNASDVETGDEVLARWREGGRLVTFCPELAGGFPVPRPRAEIEAGRGGEAVLDAEARVLEDTGGVRVFSEEETSEAGAYLRRLEAAA